MTELTWVEQRRNEARTAVLASIEHRRRLLATWEPKADRVILVDLPADDGDSPIVLANSDKERRGRHMEVLKVGAAVTAVAAGDTVIVGTYAGTVCEIERGQQVLICGEDDLLLVCQRPSTDAADGE